MQRHVHIDQMLAMATTAEEYASILPQLTLAELTKKALGEAESLNLYNDTIERNERHGFGESENVAHQRRVKRTLEIKIQLLQAEIRRR